MSESEKSSDSEESKEEEDQIVENKNKIKEEDLGDPGEDYEWASDVDSQGKQIWGKEGEDWEFYYEEDKEAYESGKPYVGDNLLNKNPISDRNYTEE